MRRKREASIYGKARSRPRTQPGRFFRKIRACFFSSDQSACLLLCLLCCCQVHVANPRGFWLVFHTLHNMSSGFVVVRVSMDHTFYHLSSLYILYTKYHPHTMPILLFLISLHVGEILCFLCGHSWTYIYIYRPMRLSVHNSKHSGVVM